MNSSYIDPVPHCISNDFTHECAILDEKKHVAAVDFHAVETGKILFLGPYGMIISSSKYYLLFPNYYFKKL